MLIQGGIIMALEFLKDLFKDGGALTYDQIEAAATEAKINGVNIADGSYISRAKYDDKVNTLNQQVKDLNGQVTQRDADLTDLQTKLTAAQTDATKLTEAQQALTGLQSKYDTDKQAWEQKNAQQAYEFMVREKANGLQFSSRAAKNEFIREAISKDFKVDGDTLLGYEDFVTKYKADDPTAFATENTQQQQTPPEKKKPDIVLPGNQPPAPDDKNGFHFGFTGVRPMPKPED
jgi:outer membrane murein-binding lipoprotein Lpp